MMDMFSQINASMAQRQLVYAQYEFERYQKALNNFRAYHGYEPHPAMNMVAIMRDYSVPWRKTTIPRVARRRITLGEP